MSWAPLLLVLGALSSCSLAQYVVTQAPSVSVPPGQSVTLTCTKTSSVNSFHWHQQKPGGAPRFVWYGSSTRGPGIPDRFSGSTSGTTGTLSITSAQPEDDAVYYCCVWDNTGYQWVFGEGTQLNVLSGETRAPSLSIFPPSVEELEKDKATLVCVLQDFYPGTVDTSWKVDDQKITNGVEKSRATKQNENNLFMASTYLSLPPTDWSAGKTVTCEVIHEGKTFSKSVKNSECV